MRFNGHHSNSYGSRQVGRETFARRIRCDALRGLLGVIVVVMFCQPVHGQRSSLGGRAREAGSSAAMEPMTREAPRQPLNPVYSQHSWISVSPRPPKTFRPGDLLTIIIREQRQWEVDARLNSRKEFDVESQLDAFVKLTEGGMGATTFRRGKPQIEYQYGQELRNRGDSRRQDRLTTRLAVKIIDVKPNGLLVFEGRASIAHDDEISVITLTGTCRKEDVSPDNSILSTQVADKFISVSNEGAMRATATRGWIPKLLDWIKPF